MMKIMASSDPSNLSAACGNENSHVLHVSDNEINLGLKRAVRAWFKCVLGNRI